MTAITSLGPLGLPFAARTFAAKTAGTAKKAAGLARKKARKQWYVLPNGIRVLATSEAYARMAAQYEAEQKRVAEPGRSPAPEPIEAVVEEASPESAVGSAPEAIEVEAPQQQTGPLLGTPPAAPVVAPEPVPVDMGLLASIAATQAMARERERQKVEALAAAERLRRLRLQDEEQIIMRILLEAA